MNKILSRKGEPTFMQTKKKPLTYKQNMSTQEVYKVIKSIGLPLALFCLGVFTISSFANFGTRLICPLSGVMWIIGVIVAFFMPSMREETLNQTMIVTATYFLTLLGLKFLLGFVSGVSSEMIAASYDQPIPTATGNAIPGWLQTIMWFDAVLLPMGDIGMQVKRLFQFKKGQTLQKTFNQKRSIRNNGKANSLLH